MCRCIPLYSGGQLFVVCIPCILCIPVYSLHFYLRVIHACIPYIFHMYSTCIPSIYHKYITCIPCIPHVFHLYSLFDMYSDVFQTCIPLWFISYLIPFNTARTRYSGYTWQALALPPSRWTCLWPPRHFLSNWFLMCSELVRNPVGFFTSPRPISYWLNILNLHMWAFILLILRSAVRDSISGSLQLLADAGCSCRKNLPDSLWIL